MASKTDGESQVPDPMLNALMEKIRAKAPTMKSWPEIIKNLRMAMSDKRHFSEVNDKQLLQKYLDILQKAIKVNGHMSLLEKLSSLSRGVGLKYTSSAPYSECFLSTDMFYVEIKVNTAGAVEDVTVVHDAGDRMSCPEVADIVNDGKFDEFTKHLDGLMSLYKINGDKKQKSRCFMALQSLEKDLNLLAQLQSSVNGVTNYIHKTPLGIVQPRIGGLPMKLVFFVPPYDLLNGKSKSKIPLTVESIMEKNLGYSCNVGIEAAATHKLQTMPLMTVNRNSDGKSLPVFSAISNQNSSALPACFTLWLEKPIVVSLAVIKRIKACTGLDYGDLGKAKPIIEWIVADITDQVTPSPLFYVTLPGQQHCYYVTGQASDDHMTGCVLTSLPFVHPTHVPQILQLLRQQIVFNTLISSCVRPNARKDSENSMIFEVNLVSMNQISVVFEHPITDSMATVELDLSDFINIKATLMSIDDDQPLATDDLLCRLVQKTFSIPLTMRALMKKATEILTSTQQAPTPASTLDQALSPEKTFPIPGVSAPGVDLSSVLPSYIQSFPAEHNLNQNALYDFDPYSMEPPRAEILDSIRAEKVAKNPMLASLLDQDSDTHEVQPQLLPALLSEPDSKQKHRKHRKRKAEARSPGSSSGKSPKRKYSEDDLLRPQEGSFDMDSNDGFDLNQQVPFPSGVAVPSSLQSQTGGGNVSNPPVARRVADVNESHVSRLKSSLENIIKQETVTNNTANQRGELANQRGELANQRGELANQRGELAALLSDDNDFDKPNVPPISLIRPPKVTSSLSSDLSTTLDDIMYNVSEAGNSLDSDMFAQSDETFTPTDFIGSAGKEPGSAGFQPDLDFNPDLLNADSNFPDTLTENSEEMDLEACDANAFGMAFNRVTSKVSDGSANTTKSGNGQCKAPLPTTSGSGSTATGSTSTAPKFTAPVLAASCLASSLPAPVPSIAAPSIANVTEKKDVKKEKKEDKTIFKKSSKPLSARIGEPKPDLDALDLSVSPQKDMKSLKALLKDSPSDEKGSDSIFTSTPTGGTSIVISAKSSPSTATKDVVGVSSLKFSVKKDRLKKSSRDDPLKRKKDSRSGTTSGSCAKDKYSVKKRRLDEDGKALKSEKSQLKPIKIRTSGGKLEIQTHSAKNSAANTSGSTSSTLNSSTSSVGSSSGGVSAAGISGSGFKSERPKEPKPDVAKPEFIPQVLPPGPPKPKLPRIPLLSKQGKPNLLDKSTISSTQKAKKPNPNITVNKSDSKLMAGKTPTIKLKPLVMPPSVTSQNSYSMSTKTLTTSTKTPPITSPSKGAPTVSPSRALPAAPIVSAESSSSTPPLTPREATPPNGSSTPPYGVGSLLALGKGKSPNKSRSLSDVINKLKAKSGGPSSGGEEDSSSPKERKKEDKEKRADKEKDKKMEKNSKSEKSNSSSSSSCSSSSSSGSSSNKRPEKSDDKLKINKPEVKKVFPSPVKQSTTKSSSYSSSSSMNSSKSVEKKPEVKKSSPSSKPLVEKRSPSPAVRDDKKESKPKDEKKERDEVKVKEKQELKEANAEVKQLTDKGRSATIETFRQPVARDSPKLMTHDSPKQMDEAKPEMVVKSSIGSPVKESPDSPDNLVIDLPATPSTKTIPMERSSPHLVAGNARDKSSPVPLPSPLVARVTSPSPLAARVASPKLALSPAISSSPVPTSGTGAGPPSAGPAPALARPSSTTPHGWTGGGTPSSQTSQSSAPQTPARATAPITSPVSNPSPCNIDDDLMDEALLGCGPD